MKTMFVAFSLVTALWLAGCSDTAKDEGIAAESHADTQPENHSEGEHAEEGEGHDEETGRLTLTPQQIEAAQIQLEQAGPARVREVLQLYGVIVPNAERVREVTARYPGMIRSVARRVGDSVRRGDALATIESNESLETYTLTAPQSGEVSARDANPGEQSGDKVLFTIADVSSVWVELSLFPRDFARVREGQLVRVRSPDRKLAGEARVIHVASIGSSASQTVTARVLLSNPKRLWAPGLYVTAEVALAEIPVAIAVRNEAIQNVEGRDTVFAFDGTAFEPRPLRLGRQDSEFSEVLEGLELNARYATRNSFILKSELGKGAADHGH